MSELEIADPVHGGEADRFGGWRWREPTRGEHFRRCDYCGSVDPRALASEKDWTAEWADRKYGWPHKFYVDLPNLDPDRLYITTSSSGPSEGLRPWAELSREEKKAAKRDGGYPEDRKSGYYRFGTHETHHAKFYSKHLADPALDPAIARVIEERSGIAFVFEGGQVAWGPS